MTLAGVGIEGSRARVVEIVRDGVRETIWAEREIILCGGTVNSPHFLMLSGMGPADHLSRLEIPDVVEVDRVPAVARHCVRGDQTIDRTCRY